MTQYDNLRTGAGNADSPARPDRARSVRIGALAAPILAIVAIASPVAASAAPLKTERVSVNAIVPPVPRSNPDLDGLHPPMATRLPSVTGTAQVGETLRCHAGAWKGSASFTFAYYWKRDATTMANATNATYRPRPSDAGKRLSCVVKATNEFGSGRAPSHPVTVRRS